MRDLDTCMQFEIIADSFQQLSVGHPPSIMYSLIYYLFYYLQNIFNYYLPISLSLYSIKSSYCTVMYKNREREGRGELDGGWSSYEAPPNYYLSYYLLSILYSIISITYIYFSPLSPYIKKKYFATAG